MVTTNLPIPNYKRMGNTIVLSLPLTIKTAHKASWLKVTEPIEFVDRLCAAQSRAGYNPCICGYPFDIKITNNAITWQCWASCD